MAVFLAALALSACARQGAAPEPEVVTLDVTHWTDKTELFMEYPLLVTGQTALFAVHLTRLADFKAVDAGRATLEFAPQAGGQPTVLVGPAPSRPGVFRVEGIPPAPGSYRWALALEAPGLADRHDLGTVSVFADMRGAEADAATGPADDPSAIAYLKEQQWVNDFATTSVRDVELRTSVRAPAVIEPVTGGEAVVTAPAAGRFAAASLLPIGTRVRAGRILGRLEPRLSAGDDRATLAARVAEAQAALEAARAEQARAERLLADRAIPARRLEDARRATTVAEAQLRAADARLAQRDETLRSGGGGASGNAFVLRAPLSGRLTEVDATLGASCDEGAALFRIMRTDEVELQAQVSAAEAPLVRNLAGLALQIPGRPDPLVLTPRHVHDSGVIDPTTRALALQIEVDNRGDQLLIGQVGTAILYTRETRNLRAVPSAAVLMEAGRPYVFVQISGESFARRPIEIAARDGDLVGITSGIKAGDRVVTRGAYDIQLASAATGLPAEGHVH